MHTFYKNIYVADRRAEKGAKMLVQFSRLDVAWVDLWNHIEEADIAEHDDKLLQKLPRAFIFIFCYKTLKVSWWRAKFFKFANAQIKTFEIFKLLEST